VSADEPNPPKITVTSRRLSYAIPNESRGVGEVAGLCCVQLEPFHSHVSPYSVTVSQLIEHVVPPNMTVTPREASKAIPMPRRAGGTVAGNTSVQVVPFHSQVSLRLVVEVHCALEHFSPPKSTATWRALSYAIAKLSRALGLAAGDICVQLLPFHSQVSETSIPDSGTPPKRTFTLRVLSNTIAAQ
jgi:hypothetical protein